MKAALDASEPKNVHELTVYLGIINYYSKFVKDQSSFLAPLNELLRKTGIGAQSRENFSSSLSNA